MNAEALDRFRAWMIDREKLAITSARKAANDVRTMRDHGTSPPASQMLRKRLRDYRWAWALWADFCESEGRRNRLPPPAELPPEPASHRKRKRRKEPKRLKEAVSIPIELWRPFLRLVEADETTAGRVIDVMCSSALRVSDVLRTDAGVIDAGFAREDGITRIVVKGSKPIVYSVLGAKREWKRLRDRLGEGQLVATAVSKTDDWTANGAAYQACRRKLHELAAAAGIEDRIYLHRLRRTVALQAGMISGNRFAVQKILNHDSPETTDGYLDEAAALESAKLLRQVRKKMRDA